MENNKTNRNALGGIIITKVREVKTPNRGTIESAGLDFYLPKLTPKLVVDIKAKNPEGLFNIYYGSPLSDGKASITIEPKSRILIPSGIKVGLPRATMLMAANKSGIATKKGCLYTAEIVDSDYTGEIHIGVINLSKHPQTFFEGDKMIQFIHMPIIPSDIIEVTNDEFTEYTSQIDSNRGEGGFGSTGK